MSYSEPADTTIGVVTCAIGIWTFFTNLLIIFAFLQEKTPFAPIFMHLAMSDTLVGVLLMFFGPVLALGRTFSNDTVSSASCVLMGWMFNVLSLVTPLLIAMLGVLRTVSVYKSVWFRNKVKPRHVQIGSVIAWLYSSLAVSVLGFRGGKIAYIPDRAFCDYNGYGDYSRPTIHYFVSLLFAAPTLCSTVAIAVTMCLLFVKIWGFRSRMQHVLRRSLFINIAFSLSFILCYSYVIMLYIGVIFVPMGYVDSFVDSIIENVQYQVYCKMLYYYLTCFCSTVNPIVHLSSNQIVWNWCKLHLHKLYAKYRGYSKRQYCDRPKARSVPNAHNEGPIIAPRLTASVT